jgi:hypothetical protein
MAVLGTGMRLSSDCENCQSDFWLGVVTVTSQIEYPNSNSMISGVRLRLSAEEASESNTDSTQTEPEERNDENELLPISVGPDACFRLNVSCTSFVKKTI